MRESEPVWYAAYGSNLLRARFMAYLEGGGVSQGGPVEVGARNRSVPLADRPLELPGWQLVFCGRSRRWDSGGVCVLVPGDGAALGRAWLITVGQLYDVWCQENSGVAADMSATVHAVEHRATVDAVAGRYRRLVPVAAIDDVAVMTITGRPDLVGDHNRPDPAYLDVVSSGLTETWGLTSAEAARYLAACPGCDGP